MADWGGGVQRGYAVSQGIIANAGPTANVPGAWGGVTLLSRADGLRLLPDWSSNTIHDRLFDVAIGPAGSEQIIYEAGHFCITGSTIFDRLMSQDILIPLSIPAGERVSIRSQASVAGVLAGPYWITPAPTGLPVYGRSTLLAADRAASRGIAVLTNATAATWGPWTQVVASTPHRILALDAHIGRFTPTASMYLHMEIAIGAAGAEKAVYSPAEIGGVESSSGSVSQRYFHIPVDIPQGERVAVRVMAQAAGARTAYMTFRGFA